MGNRPDIKEYINTLPLQQFKQGDFSAKDEIYKVFCSFNTAADEYVRQELVEGKNVETAVIEKKDKENTLLEDVTSEYDDVEEKIKTAEDAIKTEQKTIISQHPSNEKGTNFFLEHIKKLAKEELSSISDEEEKYVSEFQEKIKSNIDYNINIFPRYRKVELLFNNIMNTPAYIRLVEALVKRRVYMVRRSKLKKEVKGQLNSKDYADARYENDITKKIRDQIQNLFDDERNLGSHYDLWKYKNINNYDKTHWMTLYTIIAQPDTDPKVVQDIIKEFPNKYWLYDKLEKLNSQRYRGHGPVTGIDAADWQKKREIYAKETIDHINNKQIGYIHKIKDEDINHFIEKMITSEPVKSWKSIINEDEKISTMLRRIYNQYDTYRFEEALEAYYTHRYHNYGDQEHIRALMLELARAVTDEELDQMRKQHDIRDDHFLIMKHKEFAANVVANTDEISEE